jgi:hypothetical protein
MSTVTAIDVQTMMYKVQDYDSVFFYNTSHQVICEDIPELVVPIRISFIEGCCKQGSY